MLNILIVDDEPPARSRLRRLLGPIEACEVVAEAASAAEALVRLEAQDIDLLLLDISMPGLDGMSLAQQLAKMPEPPSVVFCTAWPDQALEAFDCDAVDYLVKPVRSERLEAALDKVARIRGKTLDASSVQYLRSVVGGKTFLINLNEVMCLVSEDKYTTVIHAQGESVINTSLIELEKKHGDEFMRVHRNALVRISLIRGLEGLAGGRHRVILEGCPIQPEVSRRHLPQLRQLIRGLA